MDNRSTASDVKNKPHFGWVLDRKGNWRAPKRVKKCPPHKYDLVVRRTDEGVPYEDIACSRCFKWLP